MRRGILFATSIASLLLLTYAGVLLAFSVPLTDEIHAANPDVPQGARAVVVPIGDAASVKTLLRNESPALLLQGDADGSFPTGATDLRMGRALLYVAPGSTGNVTIDNATIDLAAFSGGSEGWILRGSAEQDPWFSATDATLGEVARFETPAKLGALFAGGALGFVAPLVVVILTHRGGRRAPGSSAPAALVCRECRAPIAANAEFCMRCGAYTQGNAANA